MHRRQKSARHLVHRSNIQIETEVESVLIAVKYRSVMDKPCTIEQDIYGFDLLCKLRNSPHISNVKRTRGTFQVSQWLQRFAIDVGRNHMRARRRKCGRSRQSIPDPAAVTTDILPCNLVSCLSFMRPT